MTTPLTVVSPQEFVARLNGLIGARSDSQNRWRVSLEPNIMPGTYKLDPIYGVPERLVRECCAVLLKKSLDPMMNRGL